MFFSQCFFLVFLLPGSRSKSFFSLRLKLKLLPHLGLEGLRFPLASPGGHSLLLKQREEFRVRERRAVVGQPVGAS